MMRKSTPFLLALVGIAVWLAGCTVSDKGTPFANQPPTTLFTVAPQDSDTVNHYINLRWAGNDPDGDVVAFFLTVDDTLHVTTTAHDTTLGYASPVNGEVVHHTVSVSAVDNEGLEGTSATRSFYTVNFAPATVFVDPWPASVPPNAQVGNGFRMTLRGSDPNPSTMTFCISVDDSTTWTCSPDSIFLFGSRLLHKRDSDLTLVGVDDDQDGRMDEEEENGMDDDHDGRIDEDTRGLIPVGTVIVDNQAFDTLGAHTIYARVVDAGGAVSPMISRLVNVQAVQPPTMDSVVTGTYGGDDVYPDGSVYYARNADTRILFRAVANLRGEINAYRHQSRDSAWSDWSTSPEVAFTNLPAGSYVVRSVARDIAGGLSDTITYTFRIVRQNLTRNIVIVDETRNGAGVPGSPNDEQVDAFYDTLFAGAGDSVLHVDYTTQGYVSPMNLKDAGLVMWHADDRAEYKLADNTRILTEFLDRGGRLILSGWDVMSPFSSSLDSVYFSHSSFPYVTLHSQYAVRNLARTGTGFSGDNNYPGCQVDSSKVPASWAGSMDKLWTFWPRGEEVVIGRLTVSNSGNPLEGRPAAYIYDLSFRLAVFGVPLYFCYTDQVYNLFRDPGGIVDQMLDGL